MKILLRHAASKHWEPVESVAYTAEAELQRLLVETPSLITIDELREDSAPLVVGFREVGLPGSGNTDILAFSPAGDIVVVECKLVANAEIKRTVIAQVLEYGAFLWDMSYDDLNRLIAGRTGKNLADLVHEAVIEEDWDEEAFRNRVQSNLEKGAFILIIAVDRMNDELMRTIHFLNNCGRPAFIFTALEMRRYQKDSTEILVPDLFESTTRKQSAAQGMHKQWTEEEFFAEIKKSTSLDVAEVIRDIYEWGKLKANRIWFGTGKESGSFTFHYLIEKKTVSVFTIRTDGFLTFNYLYLCQQIPPEQMEQFHKELTAVPCFSHIPHEFNRWPTVSIKDAFVDSPQNLVDFKRVVEAFGEHIRK